MENFIINNPTVLHFGRDVVDFLGNTVRNYGKKALLVYGKGSIKKNGIYDQVMKQLGSAGVEVAEYAGIKPNPVISDVDNAAQLARKENVDMIIAVGGGSVLDSAKIISITAPVNHSGWEFMAKRAEPQTSLPVIAVLTLAATGSEMNHFAVVQNPETKEKPGFHNPIIFPKHSFLDPQYTISVSREYTAYGIIDLIAHSLENYFGQGEATLSDRFVYSIIEEAMEYGPELLENLQSYELRAKIMYAATNALNGLTLYGRSTGDWGVHAGAHILSVLFDTAHGATLSIMYPAWLRLQRDTLRKRIANLGSALFGVSDPCETIYKLERFFSSLGCPVLLEEANIGKDSFDEILSLMNKNQVNGACHKLNDDDRKRWLELAYGI